MLRPQKRTDGSESVSRQPSIHTPNRAARAARGPPRLSLDMLLQLACSNNRIILEAVRSWDRLTLKTRLLSPTGMHSISSSPTPAGSDSQILEILSILPSID